MNYNVISDSLHLYNCKDVDGVLLFNNVLHSWYNRSLLPTNYSYNDDKDSEFRFYDGILLRPLRYATFITQTNGYYSKEVVDSCNDFINNYGYNGLIFRVVNCKYNELIWNNLVTSLTSSISAFEDMNKFCKSEKYLFLVERIPDNMFGFDVNKYCKGTNQFVKSEEEILFPLSKDYLIYHKICTLDEFRRIWDGKNNSRQ